MCTSNCPRRPGRPAPTPRLERLHGMAPLSSVFTLQQLGLRWILTGPHGLSVCESPDEVLDFVQLVSPAGGEVRMLDQQGLLKHILQIPPAAIAESPALLPRSVPRSQMFWVFLQPEAIPAPAEIWGQWKVRPGYYADTLEVEGTTDIAGEHLTVVCYLTADEVKYGVNAYAYLGGMLTGAWTHRHELMASPLAQQGFVPGGYLARLLNDGDFDDAGLGHCYLRLLDGERGLETVLVWCDGQKAAIGTTPHTRFMVQRTIHIAAVVLAELLLLHQVLEQGSTAPSAATTPPEAKTVWDEADSTLSWLDTNLARVGNILKTLGELFDF